MLAPSAAGEGEAQGSNLIGRVARAFHPALARTEARLEWLDQRLTTLAEQRESIMISHFGGRFFRPKGQEAHPQVTLDLGKPYELESVFLIPAVRQFSGDVGKFPVRFTLELSLVKDFEESRLLHTTGEVPFASPLQSPVGFAAGGALARFVRLSVQQGHRSVRMKGEEFALSEIVVLAKGGEPVSFGAEVFAEGAVEMAGLWSPRFLTDGWMSLGIWQGQTESRNPGDLVSVSGVYESVSWSIHLDEPSPLDRILLFPYQLDELADAGIFPDSLALYARVDDGLEEQRIFEWSNPTSGASLPRPLLIPLAAKTFKHLRVVGVRPWRVGDRRLYALSEIEVWSGGKNLALGRPVIRMRNEQLFPVSSLTDGFASKAQILPLGGWLGELFERHQLEQEQRVLLPRAKEMAVAGERNTTWAAGIALGLAFVIPLVVMERRRLVSKKELDELRRRIASDLHDDIGSNLGSISLIARAAKKDLLHVKGSEALAEDLVELEEIARESSLAMRDIVWLLELGQDSVGDLVQRMDETAGRLLREIEYTIESGASRSKAKLSMEAKRHLFLFYKEAVHNIAKHSRATHAYIRIRDEEDALVLEVQDDGTGFGNKREKPASVVKKLEARAKMLHGQFQIHSSAAGTTVRLMVSRSHLSSSFSRP